MIRKFMRCVAAALCCLPVVAIAASDDPKELERILAKIQSEPLIFVIATGEPNACGRGCTEWITGEGRFDKGAAQRFREFLAVLAKRDLPIFFNSDGGLVSEAVQIGLILRENRMTAGVARTVPEGCHLLAGQARAAAAFPHDFIPRPCDACPLDGADDVHPELQEDLRPRQGLGQATGDDQADEGAGEESAAKKDPGECEQPDRVRGAAAGIDTAESQGSDGE